MTPTLWSILFAIIGLTVTAVVSGRAQRRSQPGRAVRSPGLSAELPQVSSSYQSTDLLALRVGKLTADVESIKGQMATLQDMSTQLSGIHDKVSNLMDINVAAYTLTAGSSAHQHVTNKKSWSNKVLAGRNAYSRTSLQDAAATMDEGNMFESPRRKSFAEDQLSQARNVEELETYGH